MANKIRTLTIPTRRHCEEGVLQRVLRESIDAVESTGSFAMAQVVEVFPPPELHVEGVGFVPVPLTSEAVQALLAIGEKAPFGQGQETLYDDAVRRTTQIDGLKLKFRNDAWFRWISEVSGSAAERLGLSCAKENIRAELYKMLIYEPGGMFRSHKDTEKAPGMFGTLVICLPYEHEGGAVKFVLGGETMTFESAGTSKYSVSYAAWYADVEHEVEQLISGYRVVLAYNLVAAGSLAWESGSALEAQKALLCAGLDLWDHEKPNTPQLLCYALEHQYTKAGLAISLLKGRDHHRTKFIADVCNRHGGFEVLLAFLHKVVTRGNDDEDLDGNEEVNTELGPVRTLDGFKLQKSRALRIPDVYVMKAPEYPENLWGDDDDHWVKDRVEKSRRPDSQNGGQYLGNQHDEIDKVYTDAVVMIVDRDHYTRFLLPLTSGLLSCRKMLNRLRKQYEASGRDQRVRDIITTFCEDCLRRRQATDALQDRWLGLIAAAGVHVGELDFFYRAAAAVGGNGFGIVNFRDLGRLFASGTATLNLYRLAEPISKISSLHDTWWSVVAFKEAFWPDDTNAAKEVSGFLKQRVVEKLDSLPRPVPQDAAAIIDISFYHGGLFDAMVKPIIFNHLHDPAFVNAMTVEALACFHTSSEKANTISRILDLTLDAGCSHFELVKYSSADKIEDTDKAIFPYSSWPEVTLFHDRKEQDAGLVAELFRRAGDKDARWQLVLLDKIQAEVVEMPLAQLKRLTVPVLRKLLPLTDGRSEGVRIFYKSTLATYIRRVVGPEPERPTNWNRSEEVQKCNADGCLDCKVLREFLIAPDQESATIEFPDSHDHGCFMIPWSCEKETQDGSQDGKKAIIITKTTARWVRETQAWQNSANATRQLLSTSFPEAALRDRLDSQYEWIVNLGIVRIPHAPDTQQALVPQAVPGSELEAEAGPQSETQQDLQQSDKRSRSPSEEQDQGDSKDESSDESVSKRQRQDQ